MMDQRQRETNREGLEGEKTRQKKERRASLLLLPYIFTFFFPALHLILCLQPAC